MATKEQQAAKLARYQSYKSLESARYNIVGFEVYWKVMKLLTRELECRPRDVAAASRTEPGVETASWTSFFA